MSSVQAQYRQLLLQQHIDRLLHMAASDPEVLLEIEQQVQRRLLEASATFLKDEEAPWTLTSQGCAGRGLVSSGTPVAGRSGEISGHHSAQMCAPGLQQPASLPMGPESKAPSSALGLPTSSVRIQPLPSEWSDARVHTALEASGFVAGEDWDPLATRLGRSFAIVRFTTRSCAKALCQFLCPTTPDCFRDPWPPGCTAVPAADPDAMFWLPSTADRSRRNMQ